MGKPWAILRMQRRQCSTNLRYFCYLDMPDRDRRQARCWRAVGKYANALTLALKVEGMLVLLRERLAGYKCPKRIIIVTVLPRNSYGKGIARAGVHFIRHALPSGDHLTDHP